MAVTSNITITGYDALTLVDVPIASATLVAPGDLINLASDLAVVVDAAADSDTFIGPSLHASLNGETFPIVVATRCTCRVTLASATALDIGDGLIYSAGANGTDWTFAADAGSGVDIIFWSMQQLDTAGTGPVKVFTDSREVVGARAAGAGLWDKADT
jgi:hypothetical protein